MASNKVSMPSSQGGLVRYFEEYKSKIQLKPEHMVLLIIMIILVIVILHKYGEGWLGL